MLSGRFPHGVSTTGVSLWPCQEAPPEMKHPTDSVLIQALTARIMVGADPAVKHDRVEYSVGLSIIGVTPVDLGSSPRKPPSATALCGYVRVYVWACAQLYFLMGIIQL